jgi:two-component system sensor histidine kinase UhpB
MTSPDATRPDEEVALELQSGPVQSFVAIQLLARRFQEELPSDSSWGPRIGRLAALAEEGRWQTDQIVRGVSLAPSHRGGLVAAIGELARTFEADSGITVFPRFRGTPPPLSAEAERGLYRVAHQALVNAWRAARCRAARVELTFEPDLVTLTVADDGAGLRRRWEDGFGRRALSNMRRVLESLGGTLRLRRGTPSGATVEARYPVVQG